METLIFLPGLGCDEREFAYPIKELNADYQIKTIVCDKADNMQDHIEHVLSLAPEKFTLIGHSFGGWVAQWVACLAPERVSKLILLATGSGKLTPDLETLYKEMKHQFVRNKAVEFFEKIRAQTVHPLRATDNALLNKIKVMQDEFPIDGLINQVNTDLEGKETTEHLKNIQCSTLLIHGKDDPFYEQEMWHLKNHILGSHLIEVESCGHMIPMEKPEITTVLIQHWLE